MNWQTSILNKLLPKKYGKLLVIFSGLLLATAGVVWACGYYEEDDYSIFNPGYFVDKQYSPFFYDTMNQFYAGSIAQGESDIYDNNHRYDNEVEKEWASYFDKDIKDTASVGKLLNLSANGIDSVKRYFSGQLKATPPKFDAASYRKVSKKKMLQALNYLSVAKICERFAVREIYQSWDEKPDTLNMVPGLETELQNVFKQSKDNFIRQRYWFQLVRFYFFDDKYYRAKDSSGVNANNPLVALFDKYSSVFPKNLMYYRTMGYVAGYYYHHKCYAQANYLYSLGYDYTLAMKIPSKWSFHPQEDKDWYQTLALAKNKIEKITLWHLLGMEFDPLRAIREIYKIDPKTDKLDLLLSRLINSSENGSYITDTVKQQEEKQFAVHLVDSIATAGDTQKPYFWNLAAGYLHYVANDYTRANEFYAVAGKQLPQGDTLVQAQYHLLKILVDIRLLKFINSAVEDKLIPDLTWLANLRDEKVKVADLRYPHAVEQAAAALFAAYHKQGDEVKATCFLSNIDFYKSDKQVNSLKQLLSKPVKTPFEQVMLRYYFHTLGDLNYHQATMAVYRDELDKALLLMQQGETRATTDLPANPFNSRLNDCHDCDFNTPGKTYTPLAVVKSMQAAKNAVIVGKDVYRNAWLLANAYYNITHYGNSRQFYQTELSGSSVTQAVDIDTTYREMFTSPKLAEKYYKLAREHAVNNEQRARCTFMLAKCERNAYYNSLFIDQADPGSQVYGDPVSPPGMYFPELKSKYAKTAYYKEVLNECWYFQMYIEGKNPFMK